MPGDDDRTKKPVVLVVDDDDNIREIARITLDRAGFEVDEACDGIEALAYLKNRTPDLVLLDFMLPGMDGTAVCSELRKMAGGDRVPVLMITGLSDFESITRSYNAGATDFMTKPINWTILGHRLMYMLRASQTFNELIRSEAKNRALLNAIPDVIFQIDRTGTLLDFKSSADICLLNIPEEASGRAELCFLSRPKGILGCKLHAILPDDLATIISETMQKTLETGEPRIFEYHPEVKEAEHYFEVRIVVCGKDEVLVLMRDITERKLAENHIRYMAYHDSLTRLPNINLFKDYLDHALASARHTGKLIAVLFVDLDRFKLINDTYGHQIGDLLLQATADRIISGMRRSDVVAHIGNGNIGDLVARMGGDEFTLMVPDIKKPDDVARVSYRILEELSKPFLIASNELLVTASIGIAMFPADGEDIDTLIRNADTAMYHAKIKGRNNFQFFEESMNVHIKDRLEIENRIKKALADHEFTVHYQPRFDMGTGTITGTEALLRWYPHDIFNIPVEQIITISEEINVIVPLGSFILRSACVQAAEWKKAGLTSCISVNLSVYEFKKAELVSGIKRILTETGLDSCCINFEITENVLMQDINTTTEILSELKGIGVRISVDDFGAGYSSLGMLRRLPIDYLKIAQTLIKDMTVDADSAATVKAIIALAHTLGLKVIAEGVETEDQFKILKQEGCDEVQGFFCSRAIPSISMTKLLIEEKKTIFRSSAM